MNLLVVVRVMLVTGEEIDLMGQVIINPIEKETLMENIMSVEILGRMKEQSKEKVKI